MESKGAPPRQGQGLDMSEVRCPGSSGFDISTTVVNNRSWDGTIVLPVCCYVATREITDRSPMCVQRLASSCLPSMISSSGPEAASERFPVEHPWESSVLKVMFACPSCSWIPS